MDESPEMISPLDVRHDLDRVDVALLLRCSKVNAAMRSLLVVGP